MKRTYIYCKECLKVVEKYTCEHYGGGYTRDARPIARYFEGPDGKTYVPAKAEAPMPARLKKLGYVEKTISNAQEYSAAMKKMDQKAIREHEQYTEALKARFEAQQKEERAQLREMLKDRPYGREIYEETVRQSERQQYGEGRYDPGSRIDGFEGIRD